MYAISRYLAWVCVQVSVGCGFNAAVDGPPAGNPHGTCLVPAEAQAEDSSKPDHVIGNGISTSCTSDEFVNAVAAGGVITFNCGSDPVIITLDQTAVIFSDSGPKVVIDGGGKVALSGGGKVRILYLNVCDPAQGWPTSDCANVLGPQITVQNLTFIDGNTNGRDFWGGGAIFANGGRLKVINSRFFRNVCNEGYPESGGGAIRTVQSPFLPVYIVNSTFGGQDGLGNRGLNGGALASDNGTYTIINSLISYNWANGPMGASGGGGIYALTDQNLSLCGVQMTNNRANWYGGAIWFHGAGYGLLSLSNSTLSSNQNEANNPEYPGISMQGRITVQSSVIE